MGALSTAAPYLWLKADAITGLADGDPISTWPDSGSGGNNATQATSTAQPTYKTAVSPTGLAVARFDGTSDLLVSGASASDVDQTMIVVLKRGATGALHTIRGGSGNSALQWRLTTADKQQLGMQGSTTVATSTTSVGTSSFVILACTYSAGVAYSEVVTSLTNQNVIAPVDGSTSTFWEAAGTPSVGDERNLTVRPRTSTVATSYTLTPRNTFATRAPKDFKFQGSMDGVSWTDIDTQTGITSWTGTTPIAFSSFSNSTAWTYYRLSISATNGATPMDLAEFKVNSLAPGTGSYAFYYNGAADGSGSTSVNTLFDRTTTIGRATSSEFLNGDLAELAVFKRVLTSTELTDIYNELRDKWINASAISGQVDAVSATDGAVTASLLVAGQVDGTSGVEGTLVGVADYPVSGQVDAVSGTEGTVVASVDFPVDGQVDAVSGTIGAITETVLVEGQVNSATMTEGTISTTEDFVTAGSTTEASGAAETPIDGTDTVTANSSTTTASGHAETPSDSERVIAGSTTATAGHAAVALNVAIDPVTLRPQYRIIVVDSFGVPLGELQNAVFGDRVQTLGARGGFTFTLPKDDPKVTLLPQYAQVQLWIGAEMLPEAWFYIVDPGKDSGDVWTYQCSGIRWLLENVRIGKERPELLLNGGFEEGIKHWHPVWFAGSAAEAPPDVEIVTGAAALDGGKALQTTAVEKVIVKEVKTAAIFYGNRPYASEALSAGFLPGGEQVIRDAVKDFAKGIAITVEGYTADVDGGTGLALSQRRADAAKAVINAYRPDLSVTAIGRGETVQVAPNNTPENQAKNRRIVITGGSTRIGHRQAVNQWFSYTNNDRVAVELELDGWINLIDYVGPSKDRYGLYINRRNHTDASKVEDVQHTDLPPTFPKERWTPDGTSILAPADGLSHWYEVRLYGAAGDSKFDEISCKPNLYTRFYNVDRPTLIKGLVEHAQSPTFGKVSLNLETRCPAFGAKDDYEYAWKDHRTVDDAIDEVLRADDAPDFWVATTETRRIATTASRRGRYTGIVLELGGIVTDYTSAVAGDEVATTGIVTSNRDGGGAAEAFVRGAPLNGLVLERLQAAEPNRQVSRLKAMGRAMLRYGRTDVVTSVTCDPEWTVYLLGHVGPGDVCSVRIDDGSLDADGDYRIVEVQHSIARHQLTFQLVPEV